MAKHIPQHMAQPSGEIPFHLLGANDQGAPGFDGEADPLQTAEQKRLQSEAAAFTGPQPSDIELPPSTAKSVIRNPKLTYQTPIVPPPEDDHWPRHLKR